MRITASPIPLLLGLLLPACGSGPGGGGPDGGGPDGGAQEVRFNVETVDDSARGEGTAIAITPAGATHLFYFGQGDPMTCNLAGTPTTYYPSELFHAARAGGAGAWTRLSLGKDTEASGVSALIDPKAGQPVASFQGGMHGIDFCGGAQLQVARFDGSRWARAAVVSKAAWPGGPVYPGGPASGPVEKSGDVVGLWSALGVSPAGLWFLAYQDIHFGYADNDFSKATLELATSADGRTWTTGKEGVAAAGAGRLTTLAFDKQGRLVLSFSGTAEGPGPDPPKKGWGLSTAARTAENTFGYAQRFPGAPTPSAIAAAPRSGRLGLAYYDAAYKVLRFVEGDDALKLPADAEAVDRDGDVGRFVSLRYDSGDHPVIAYWNCGKTGMGCDPATDSVRVARRRDDGTWQVTEVDTGGDAACGSNVSLGLYADDKAAIVYQCSVFDHMTNKFKPTVRYAREE